MFVSDELMGKLLKSTNITTEDVEEDEINERSIRIVKRAEALKKAGKWEDADRSGVEYYFLKSFMTNDLYKDFPVIRMCGLTRNSSDAGNILSGNTAKSWSLPYAHCGNLGLTKIIFSLILMMTIISMQLHKN